MTGKKLSPPWRAFRNLGVITLLLTAVIGCGGNRTGGQTDGKADSGTVTRIISTAPSNTEIIAGLGLADNLIAADKYSLEIPGVPGDLAEIDFFYPDAEMILTLNPDIIISNEHNTGGTGGDPFALIQEAGIRVVYIPTSGSIAGIYGDIQLIADALGVPERGLELTEAMGRRIQAIADIGASIQNKKSVYFEISPAPYLYSFGRNTFLNDMIETAGGKNIFADVTGWIAPSAEAVIDKNPDVIFTSVPGNALEELKTRNGFEHIQAVINNELYFIDANSAARPSQHIVIALAQMAKALYPDKYAEL
jgi:iron complex transport system substrate-binding protein